MPLLDLLLGIDNSQHVDVRLAWQDQGINSRRLYGDRVCFTSVEVSKSELLDMVSFAVVLFEIQCK